jgi:undecaprenyl-diphosphatase
MRSSGISPEFQFLRYNGKMSSFNLALFNAIYNFGHRNIFFQVVAIFFAQYLAYLLVAAFLVLVLLQKETRGKIHLFCEGALAIILARGIIAESIKFFYNHPRPFDILGFTPLISESGSSFPSGHMAWFFAVALVVYYANRKWGIWFFVLSFLMGIARIYVGVHWPLDILGGILVGLLSALFVHWILRASRKELSSRPLMDSGSAT